MSLEKYYELIELDKNNIKNVKKFYTEILKEMMNKIGMNSIFIILDIEYVDDSYDYAGKWERDNTLFQKITLYIKKSYSFDDIIYIIAHELSHHVLSKYNISFEDILENEILTDLETIYIGCNQYVLNSLSKYKRIKLGYISKSEYEYALKKLKK